MSQQGGATFEHVKPVSTSRPTADNVRRYLVEKIIEWVGNSI